MDNPTDLRENSLKNVEVNQNLVQGSQFVDFPGGVRNGIHGIP
ncbi:MAG: hypothetical protein ABEI53_03920 [Candidatus Magasanikbacteria bacterium]